MVLILGILLANLLTIWIDQLMLSYKWKYAPHVSTWIGMGIVVIIYYPLFTRIDKWAGKIGDRFLKAGKKFIGREIGTFFAFLAALLILFYLYGREWFNSNVIRSLIQSF
ncbi:MAG: hypothetical protein JXR22_13300 [Prolixibacteraceae bacterium]|nr:hypothetical protein [Prolixibacteraceae bacterium]